MFAGTSRVFGWAGPVTGTGTIWDFIGKLLWDCVVDEYKF